MGQCQCRQLLRCSGLDVLWETHSRARIVTRFVIELNEEEGRVRCTQTRNESAT
jgi:hypothetical protein